MERSSAARVKPPLVLVVEDQRELAETVCGLLEDAGYATVAAATLRQARRLLSMMQPASIVLDVTLPDGDAEELLSELTGHHAAPPTVLLSASARARAIATRFGIAHVQKPFDMDHLLAAVHISLDINTRPRDAFAR